MILQQLKLLNFKNYQDESFSFSPGINCVLGANGMGKTNLLDAIHYLYMTRSFQSNADIQNIQFEAPYFSISGLFENDLKVDCYFESGKKKIFRVNGSENEKLSDHIGTIPGVLTTPEDNQIINEGSEIRRKLFDRLISQYDKAYLEKLILTQKLLNQRNSFLKQNDGKRGINRKLLETYDDQLIPLFESITNYRSKFLSEFIPYFSKNYTQIFKGDELPSIEYKSHCLNKDFANQFKSALEKDVVLQRTTMGSHKDDYLFLLNERSTKKFSSQGQQKSFVIALKLAEFDFLKQKKETTPLLLLDDIFDKLDDERINHLVSLLTDQERFSQIFITDARAERSKTFFETFKSVSFFEIKSGRLL